MPAENRVARSVLSRSAMRAIHLATVTLSSLLAAPFASAADAVAPSQSDDDSQSVRTAVGLHVGSGIATGRLDASVDVSAEFSARKRTGPVILSGGLRPHYERFAFGDSQVVSCTGVDSCGPSMAVRSVVSSPSS